MPPVRRPVSSVTRKLRITLSATVENSASKTSEEMKKSEFLNLLNKEEENYKQDSNLINKGYPILNWQ